MFLKFITLFCLTPTIFVNCLIFDFKRNTCTSFSSYTFQFLKANKKCYRNGDLELTMMERLILHVGNAAENYTVITPDGYILEIFRMRRDKPKGVILLQHPYSQQPKIWTVQPNESIALRFWHMGYDVWLPAHRGTKNGPVHINPNMRSKDLWDFDFHEIALYDYPTTIGFVYDKVNTKVVFIGYSMAATASVVYACLKPNDAVNKVKVIIPLALLTYTKHVKGLIKYGAPLYRLLQIPADFFGIYTIFNENVWYMKLARFLIWVFPFKQIFPYMPWFLAGGSPYEIDPEIFYATSTAVTSSPLKSIYHYAQMCKEKNFLMYNYGKARNLEIYNQTEPLAFPLQNIQVPIYMLISDVDFISTKQDNEYLYEQLPKKAKVYGKMEIKGVAHLDYLMGIHRNQRVWDPIMRFLETI